MTPRGAGEPAGLLPPRGVAQVTTPSSRPIAPRPSPAHISFVRRPFTQVVPHPLADPRVWPGAGHRAPRRPERGAPDIPPDNPPYNKKREYTYYGRSTCTMRCIAAEVVRGVHRGCATAGVLCTVVVVAHGRGGAARRATRRRSGRWRRWAACLAAAPITVHSATPPVAPRGARHSDRALSGAAAQRAQELRAAHRGL
jgi:hypothetical protein